MGGGMLKVEPGEAEACLLAGTRLKNKALSNLADELDALIRDARSEDAQEMADQCILRTHAGLTKSECRQLKEGAETLMNRRCHRG